MNPPEDNLKALLAKKQALIMGVCNITPDSFSDGGEYLEPEKAVRHVSQLFKKGSDIIDIGGEASGPGSKAVSATEELLRVLPVVSRAVKFGPVSIDTYKAAVAAEALQAGAQIVNDISALRGDPDLAPVIAQQKAYIVLMFSKESGQSPHVSNRKGEYDNLLDQIICFLEERILYAERQGIASEKIILDPGMGSFISKDPDYSWELLRDFASLSKHFSEYPLLIATSRKGFLGGEISTRDPLSQLTALDAVKKGAKIIRTHCPGMAASFLSADQRLAALL